MALWDEAKKYGGRFVDHLSEGMQFPGLGKSNRDFASGFVDQLKDPLGLDNWRNQLGGLGGNSGGNSVTFSAPDPEANQAFRGSPIPPSATRGAPVRPASANGRSVRELIDEALGNVSSGYTPQSGYAGGGGGYGGPDPLDALADANSQTSAQLAQVESSYAADSAALKEMFSFAETPQEKAAIAFQLRDLEAQRDAAKKIIGNEYAKAIGYAESTEADMREAADVESGAMADLYRESAGRAGDAITETAGQYADTGLGVEAAPVSGDATDWVAMMEAAAPREAALTERLGNIAADDVGWMGQTLNAEQGAQQGDLQRLALGLRAGAIQEHQAAVNSRIEGERGQYRNAAIGMQSDYRGRQYGLEDRAYGLQMERAGMLEGRRSSAQDYTRSRQASAQDFARNQRASEAQYGRERRNQLEDLMLEYEMGGSADRRALELQREFGGDGGGEGAPPPQTLFEWVALLAGEGVGMLSAARSGELGPLAQDAAEAIAGGA